MQNNNIIYPLIHRDDRGFFAELLFASKHPFKQISMIRINPGHERGGHLHKNRTEYFFVVEGTVKFTLEDNKGGIRTIILHADSLHILQIDPMIKHSVSAMNDTVARCMVVASDEFDKDNTDTYK